MSESSATIQKMDRFFWLAPPSGRAFSIDSLGDHSLSEIRRYAHGVDVPNRPVRLHWAFGRKQPADVVWLEVSSVAISPRLLQLLEGFSGWSTYPIEIYDAWGALCPGYAGLAITGRCDRVLFNLDRIEKEPKWEWLNYVGLHFSLDSWDRSDLFYPSVGIGPVVTEQLQTALRKAKITNVRLERLSELRIQKTMVDDMRDRRVAVYAETLPPEIEYLYVGARPEQQRARELPD